MYRAERNERSGFGHFIVRFLLGSIVLATTAFLTPGFVISSTWTLFLAALALSMLDWLVSNISGINATPFGRGISGFILSATILYVVQYIVPGYSISLLSAIIGAVIYGVVDAIIPGRSM